MKKMQKFCQSQDKFGKTNVIKIDHILDLPFQIKNMVVESSKNQND